MRGAGKLEKHCWQPNLKIFSYQLGGVQVCDIIYSRVGSSQGTIESINTSKATKLHTAWRHFIKIISEYIIT